MRERERAEVTLLIVVVVAVVLVTKYNQFQFLFLKFAFFPPLFCNGISNGGQTGKMNTTYKLKKEVLNRIIKFL